MSDIKSNNPHLTGGEIPAPKKGKQEAGFCFLFADSFFFKNHMPIAV